MLWTGTAAAAYPRDEVNFTWQHEDDDRIWIAWDAHEWTQKRGTYTADYYTVSLFNQQGHRLYHRNIGGHAGADEVYVHLRGSTHNINWQANHDYTLRVIARGKYWEQFRTDQKDSNGRWIREWRLMSSDHWYGTGYYTFQKETF